MLRLQDKSGENFGMMRFISTRCFKSPKCMVKNARGISGGPSSDLLSLGGPSLRGAQDDRTSIPSESSVKLVTDNTDQVLRRLSAGDYSVSARNIQVALSELDSEGLPDGFSVLSLRGALLQLSRKLEPGTIVLSLKLFANEGISDHNFFKEMGMVLLPHSAELSISEISSLLKSHAAIGATESDLFSTVCSRLSSVINRASMHTIREILTSLSLLGASLADSQRMIELCLNRYSLCVKDDLSVEIDRDVLLAMARLRIPNARVIKMASSKIAARTHQLDVDSLARILGSLSVLGIDSSAIWRATKRRYFADLSLHPTAILSDLGIAIGSFDIDFSVKAAASCAMRSMGIRNEVYTESVGAYKHALNLTALNLTETERFEMALSKLSVEELKALQRLLKLSSESVEIKQPPGSFLECRPYELTRKNVSGLFSTQLIQNSKKPQKSTKKSSKIHK